jgi:hypothetical protein
MYTLYNSNGQITMMLHGNDNDSIDLTLQGQNYIAGNYPADKYYIDNGVAVEKMLDPSTDLQKFTFNYATKKYEIDFAQTTLLTRQHRNSLLSDIDRVNPVWYAALTADQQAELQIYRQALLAVPQQTGFPSQVEWPTKPQWL